jgi:rare lipoprotein A
MSGNRYLQTAILFGTIFVLAACGTAHRVRVEPGPAWLRPWERPYWVDDDRYVPLLDAQGFKEEGLASWYGKEEHGRTTSNGEIFDMHRMTAAHKILPLGCRIRVRNKLNGKEVIVRVNDRGPFVTGRIVDLSYRAALDLGIVGGGIAPVAIEVQGATK